MRDQYAGDVSDVLKFAFLRALAGADRTLGIAWYYAPGDDGRPDGRHLEWRDEAAFRQQQAKIASQGFDRFLMNLAEGYVESITGVLDQKYASCREDAAAGKAISAECIDVDMRYHAKQVAIREQKREECRRTHRDKTECEH